MGLPIVRFDRNDGAGQSWGVHRDGNVYPLQTVYPSHRDLMDSYFTSPEAFLSGLGATPIEVEAEQFISPVSQDVQLYCQGLNYADHRKESGVSAQDDDEGLMFMKAASSICPPNAAILRPRGCQLLDYEIELALVLKRDIAGQVAISDSDLPAYVGAVILCNDVSARDFMFGAPMLQWFKGKSQRTFCPMGPVLYLMDAEDFRYLFALQLELKLNGQVRQSASTDLLIHRPAKTLSDISAYADMRAGDCLLTGTPGGVLAGTYLKVGLSILLNFTNDRKRRLKFTEAQLARTRFLEPGDVLELSIRTSDGAIDLGRQRNVIADA
ncbi:MAG: fumarylacetoacetate hydrolase family protein [Halieaceae bacterium]|nr:fumarylacetoacetate hydrolase family protein [Halieaceae bacterium]